MTTLTIRQRAGLQVLGHALTYLGGSAMQAQDDTRAVEDALDAGQILWRAREAILRAAERRPRQRVKLPSAPVIVWRNPQAGVQ